MGKPKCTSELIEQAVELKRGGMSNKDMCACLGISETTLYKWIGRPSSKRQVELAEALKRTESDFKAALRSRIIGKSSDDWKAAAWMLERMYPTEYARPEVRLAHDQTEAARRGAQEFIYFDRKSAEDGEHGA